MWKIPQDPQKQPVVVVSAIVVLCTDDDPKPVFLDTRNGYLAFFEKKGWLSDKAERLALRSPGSGHRPGTRFRVALVAHPGSTSRNTSPHREAVQHTWHPFRVQRVFSGPSPRVRCATLGCGV